jgi:hypothetical protein
MGYSNCQNDLRSPYVHSSSIPITRPDRHVPTVRQNSTINNSIHDEFLETIRQLIDRLVDLNMNISFSLFFWYPFKFEFRFNEIKKHRQFCLKFYFELR